MAKDVNDDGTLDFLDELDVQWNNGSEKRNEENNFHNPKDLKPSTDCVDLIEFYEGFRSEAYKDSVGVWTIGFGTTRGVKKGDTINKDEARERMLKELDRDYAQVVRIHVKVTLTQSMFDALCSLIYNIGGGNFANSTLKKCLNQKEYKKAVDEFSKWIYAGGEVLNGLVKRRKSEAELFIKDGF